MSARCSGWQAFFFDREGEKWGECYTNAKAERLYGILTYELGWERRFKDFKEILKYVEDAVRIMAIVSTYPLTEV